MYIYAEIWSCRLVKTEFSQLFSVYGRFQGYMASDLCCA